MITKFPAKEVDTAKTHQGDFTLWQSGLANRLGISEEELRARRDRFLTRDLHWRKKGTRIFYTEKGADVLRRALCLPLESPGPEKTPPAPTDKGRRIAGLLAWPFAPNPTELKVWRTWPVIKNTHVLEAYDPATDPKVRANILIVRVSSNLNFVREMRIPVRHIEGNFYELARRAPRQKGRW